MSKLVRRSHFDLFLRIRSNHLQFRIRPGTFWNDIVSVFPLEMRSGWGWNRGGDYFRVCYEDILINDRLTSEFFATEEPILCPVSHGRKYWQLCKNGGSLTFVWVKESFGFYSGQGDLPLKGSKQNVGREMATRNLTEIYINLRTEISRFKAYSLGDSVRSDSPGVLYWHILPPKHTLCVLCCTRWRTFLMMICFDLI